MTLADRKGRESPLPTPASSPRPSSARASTGCQTPSVELRPPSGLASLPWRFSRLPVGHRASPLAPRNGPRPPHGALRDLSAEANTRRRLASLEWELVPRPRELLDLAPRRPRSAARRFRRTRPLPLHARHGRPGRVAGDGGQGARPPRGAPRFLSSVAPTRRLSALPGEPVRYLRPYVSRKTPVIGTPAPRRAAIAQVVQRPRSLAKRNEVGDAVLR